MSLLTFDDPNPVQVVNAKGKSEILLTCEHAGNAIPYQLNNLSMIDEDLQKHIAWDIGARELACLLSEKLDAPLILQYYSRLVIDCNRPTNAPDSMAQVSDHIPIPANQNLSEAEKQSRIDEIFQPYQNAISTFLDQSRKKMAISIHSFTPVMDGFQRPWDIGFLGRKGIQTSIILMEFLKQYDPDLNVALNQPYHVKDIEDWFIPYHGERRGIPHCLIEVRNDHLLSSQNCLKWAEILTHTIHSNLKKILNVSIS